MGKDRVERTMISAEVAARVPLWRQILEKHARVNRAVAALGRQGGISPEELEKYQQEAEKAEEELRLARQLRKAKES